MASVLTVTQTDLPLPVITRGKVRDVYDLGDRILLVATDRISAFDVVLPTPIPHKGAVLTQIALFWFQLTESLSKNHILKGSQGELPAEIADRPELAGRSTVAIKTKPFPVECVARGYLSGSAWSAYRKETPRDGIIELWGVRLPSDLKESDRLPEPIFTPTTKAQTGHDESLTFRETFDLVGREVAESLRDRTLAVYLKGCDYAESRGLILADTKFEFGERDGEILLIDELLTPDSSRFWDREIYKPGQAQPSFDKQFVRDWLQALVDAGQWKKEPPGPELPGDVVEGTSQRYLEAYRRVTGSELSV
jgi:phosphoribosylaminoimidazole-succinocarboxamide synthase